MAKARCGQGSMWPRLDVAKARCGQGSMCPNYVNSHSVDVFLLFTVCTLGRCKRDSNPGSSARSGTQETSYEEGCARVSLFLPSDRLVGLVVRRPPRERKIPGSNPACAGIFSGSSQTSDFKIGTPVATLPGAWRYRVSAGTGGPGVSIL